MLGDLACGERGPWDLDHGPDGDLERCVSLGEDAMHLGFDELTRRLHFRGMTDERNHDFGADFATLGLHVGRRLGRWPEFAFE